MKKCLYIFLIFGSLQGVCRRDDVPDAEYLNFGKDLRFSCVGFINGPIGSATGTLIDPYTVLTVAHVVQTLGEEVVFNLIDPSSQTIISLKGHIQIHEQFFYTQKERSFVKEIHNDIALIHLYSPVHFVKPAILDYTEKPYECSFVSAGFGKNGAGNQTLLFYDKARRGYTNKITELFSKSWCDDSFISFFDAPGTLDCTELEGIGTQGDSGSGVFLIQNNDFYLFGLSYLLAGQADYNSFNLILPIAPYEEWIESNRYHN